MLVRTQADDAAVTRWTRGEAALLYVDHCPSYGMAAQRLREAIALSGVEPPRVTWRPIHTVRSAAAAGFAGSPTFLFNGIDPFPRPPSAAGLCCRLYRTADGLSGAPSVEQLVAALRTHFAERVVSTTCSPQPEVAAFLLGALTIAEEHDLMAHVAGCLACQGTLAELVTVPDMLALVPRSMAELIHQSGG